MQVNGQATGGDYEQILAAWDRGDLVTSVSLGGIGPGYEMAIQGLLMEILREAQGSRWPSVYHTWEAADAERLAGITRRAVERCDGLPWAGFSGAQVDAAQSAAACILRRGGFALAMQDPQIVERLIVVCKRDLRGWVDETQGPGQEEAPDDMRSEPDTPGQPTEPGSRYAITVREPRASRALSARSPEASLNELATDVEAAALREARGDDRLADLLRRVLDADLVCPMPFGAPGSPARSKWDDQMALMAEVRAALGRVGGGQ